MAVAQKSLAEGIARSQGEGRPRPVLIYPEGHLTPVGEGLRYRSGVWRLSQALDRPIVPVATNLGQCWPQQGWAKFSGTAVIEFMDPIAPSADRDVVLAELESRVEARSRELEAEYVARFAPREERAQSASRPVRSCA